MPGESLSLSERVQIEVGVAAGERSGVIAAGLARPGSTISREFTRNGGRARYDAVKAQARADRQRARPKATVFASRPWLADHVEKRLRALDSPMTIAVELDHQVWAHDPGTVSHETIYRAIYAHGHAGLAKGLHRCLHRGRRRRQVRRTESAPTKRGPLGDFNLITLRPRSRSTGCRSGISKGI